MIFVRSLIFNFLFIFTTLLLGIIFFPLILSEKASVRLSSIWARLTIFYLKIICKINIDYKGYEKFGKENNIFAVRHESALDTILFLDYFTDAKYVMKSELKIIPIYGWFAVRCGHILINRMGGANTLREMLGKIEKKLLMNNKLIIFPHGTRIESGSKQSIQSGIFAIYKYTNASIIPVYVSSGREWDINGFIKRPGNIEVLFYYPIKGGLEKKEFIKKLESKINP